MLDEIRPVLILGVSALLAISFVRHYSESRRQARSQIMVRFEPEQQPEQVRVRTRR